MSFINFLDNFMEEISPITEPISSVVLYYGGDILVLSVVTFICYSIVSLLSKCMMNKKRRKNLSNRYYRTYHNHTGGDTTNTGYYNGTGYNSHQGTRKKSSNNKIYNYYTRDNTLFDAYLISETVKNSDDYHDCHHNYECHEHSDYQDCSNSYEYDSYDCGDSYDSCDCSCE